MNDKLVRFIKRFEKEFGSLLQTPSGPTSAIYTDYCLIYVGKQKLKYSDWDIVCWLKPAANTPKNILKIENFIRGYDELGSVGRLLASAQKYAPQTSHYIDTTRSLHYMGIFLDEQNCPFFDMKIKGVEGRTLREAFTELTDEEFESWILLTAWRKLRNSESSKDKLQYAKYEKFLSEYLIPFYAQDAEEINKGPISFFKRSVPYEKYQEAIRFISS